MHRKKSWDDVGVSEVIGTIMILGMTVTLFTVVLLWVYSTPTPSPDVKVDLQGSLVPMYTGNTWAGANITLRHNGGETLNYLTTVITVRIYRGTNICNDNLKTVGTLPTSICHASQDNGKPYGLIDGSDNAWNVGERWLYTSHYILPTDQVEVLVIDTGKSVLLWEKYLRGQPGLNPPIFVDKWADLDPSTPTIETPKTGLQFTLFAKVVDPDGDLDKNSVYTTITAFYGSKDFREIPQRMLDNGTGGDQVANDGIFTFTKTWLKPTNLTWDGSVVIFNATDMLGHSTTSRMTLSVLQGPVSSGGGGKKPPPSGEPPNLHYNGLQGFNLFNATEWDNNGYAANETRTFKEKETVVVVVASALLQNARGAHNEFYLYDPFSSLPPEPVVYGNIKVPTDDTQASNTLAFTFYQYVNGYNVFTYRFELNNASSVGINYKSNPARPPEYYFGKYPLEMTLWDDVYPQPSKFHTTDTINITDNNGNMLTYPRLETFKDPNFTVKTNTFNNTDVIYVRITMRTVDDTYDVGNVVIQDYLGGLQVWKAPLPPTNPPYYHRYVNQPICPRTGACTTGTVAVEKNQASISYRFALNLSLANQDPWVPGTQNYALRILSVRDIDEEYTLALQSQLTIWAPEYRLDIAIANDDVANNAWGTHDLAYYFENINSWDKWGPPPVRGLFTGTAPPNAWSNGQAIRYLDYDLDGDLDIVASFKQDNQNSWLYIFRRDVDTNGNTIWTLFTIDSPMTKTITAIASGSIDRDTAPEIVVGDSTGSVWYYKNDGSWTRTPVDYSRTGAVNGIDLGDFDGDHDLDIAVARSGGIVTWYPNIDGNGKFTTTAQTDWWRATQDNIVTGTIVAGNYTSTWVDEIPPAPKQREQLKEGVKSYPNSYSNGTIWTSGVFTYGSTYSGTFQDTWSKNGVFDVLSETTCSGNKQCLQAVWPIYMPAGSTHKFKVNGFRSNNDAGDTFTFKYSTNSNGPWTTLLTLTNASQNDYYWTQSFSIPGYSGIVYIQVVDNFQGNNEPADKLYIDHMYIETYIPAKTTSALEHYYKLQQLPNRPSSVYTMNVLGSRQNSGAEEQDQFLFFYSMTGQNGYYYGPVINVSATTEPATAQSYTLPVTVSGQTLWVKVIDSDRTAGRNNNDSLYVNALNVSVATTGGVTGKDMNVFGGNDVMVLDAGDQNADNSADLVIGTSGGNVYKIMGSPGVGLVPPTVAFASPGGSISGVKFADCYFGTGGLGLEIVASAGATVYIYRADGITGTVKATLTTPNSETITALTAGDVDGDHDDDIVAATGGTNIGTVVYWRNNAGSWVLPNPYPPGFTIRSPIRGIALGDVSDSRFQGR